MLRITSIVRVAPSNLLTRGLLLGVLVLGGACPGGLDSTRYDKGAKPSDPDGGPPPVYDAWSQPTQDSKPISADVKLPAADSTPTPVPDTKPPLPPDQGLPPAGGPCSTDANCVAGLQKCVNKKCYNLCTTTDACGVVSKCAPTEACVMLNNNPATKICYPATAQVAGACGGVGLFCPNGFLCAAPNGPNPVLKCEIICSNPGAACTTGGTCVQTNTPGCNVCL